MKQIGLSALKSKSLVYDVGNNDNVLVLSYLFLS